MTNPSRASVPQRRAGVLVQQVKPQAESVVLLVPKTGQYYTLDLAGARIWELCDGNRTISEIAGLVANEYDESAEVIERDVIELVQELIDEALVDAAP